MGFEGIAGHVGSCARPANLGVFGSKVTGALGPVLGLDGHSVGFEQQALLGYGVGARLGSTLVLGVAVDAWVLGAWLGVSVDLGCMGGWSLEQAVGAVDLGGLCGWASVA